MTDPGSEGPSGGVVDVGAVHGGLGTAVGSAGDVHTGSGDQNTTNFFATTGALVEMLGGSAGGVRPRPAEITTPDEVVRNRKCFVTPSGFPIGADRAAEPCARLFTGQRGSGRRGAALRWLDMVGGRDEGAPVRALPDGEQGGESGPLLRVDRVVQGELLILDTSEMGGDGLSALLKELGGFTQAVEDHRARLAVIADHEHERRFPGALRQRSVAVTPPDRTEVLRSHLRVMGITPPDEELREDGVRAWLDVAEVQEAADLAVLVLRAGKEVGGRGAASEWFKAAFGAISDWSGAVADQLARARTSADRAVLLSAAMLEGMSAERVHSAAERLLAEVEAPKDALPPLERPGFATRLHRLGVRIHPDRRIEFPRFRYGEAVRNRLWDEYPDLRGAFASWAEGLPEALDMAPTEQERLAERYIGQLARFKDTEKALALAARWAGAAPDGRPLKGAHGKSRTDLSGWMLKYLLEDEHAAAVTRQRLYDWSRSKGLPTALGRASIAICSEVLAYTHPNQAIVRLHHLVRMNGPPVSAEAAQELIGLAIRRGHAERILDRLAWRMGFDQALGRGVHDADADLFWQATSPEVLAARGRCPPPPSFLKGLSAVLGRDKDEARRHALRWLGASEADPGRDAPWGRSVLPHVAKAAVASGRDRVVHGAALRWVARAPMGMRRARRGPAHDLVAGVERERAAASARRRAYTTGREG